MVTYYELWAFVAPGRVRLDEDNLAALTAPRFLNDVEGLQAAQEFSDTQGTDLSPRHSMQRLPPSTRTPRIVTVVPAVVQARQF